MSSPIDHTRVTAEQIQSALSWKPRTEGEEILQRIVFQLQSDLIPAEQILNTTISNEDAILVVDGIVADSISSGDRKWIREFRERDKS